MVVVKRLEKAPVVPSIREDCSLLNATIENVVELFVGKNSLLIGHESTVAEK